MEWLIENGYVPVDPITRRMWIKKDSDSLT
jgi:hypothetical protein